MTLCIRLKTCSRLPLINDPECTSRPTNITSYPAISSGVVTNATERAWHGRNELFTERFDDFLRINRLFTPTPENNSVVTPSPPQSPAADARETTAASTSPRPFSRSARSVLSSSRPRNITTNPSLGDHPLPSPILRDLRSWLEEGPSASLTTSASATQASSSTASESATSHQDRLSRMLDRIRRAGCVEGWAGHGIRREWLSPPPPTPSAPAPSVKTDSAHRVRDLLPWFTGDPAPALAFGAAVPSATLAASRPISTTPAPGNSMVGRSKDLALDSYWGPVFTNLPESTFASTSSTQNGTSEQGSNMAASDDQPSDNAVTTASRPTLSLIHVEAGSSPGYLSHIMRHSGDARRTINPADASNNGDRHTNDPAAGMWHPLEPSDLPLSLSFNSTSTSNSNTRPQPPLIHTPPNYFDHPPSPSFDSRSIPDTSYLYGTSFLNRSMLETYGSGWASPLNPGTNPMAI
ncbi:hypothetical protein BJ912DRAFT_1063596 [Pholiota molesta]|nr:hypothetical protein BJ912DRAFT_1063596 [Pholiota molesta]